MPKGIALPSWQETSAPQEIVAVWDTIIRNENDKSYRGFAARVMFYDANSKKALKVRGNFDVYVFDEEATGKAATVPAKIVRYQMNDLKALQSNSKMFGTSYTLWVPWDEMLPDSEEKKLSLFVRFKCDDGTIIVSKQATATLPGSPEKIAEKTEFKYETTYIENQLRQTAYLAERAEQRKFNSNSFDTEWNGTVAEHIITKENRPQTMLTTTINMPGISRDGLPNITPERKYATSRYASVTDEQKRQAQALLANAGIAQPNRPMQQTQAQPLQTQQPLQNAVFAADPNSMGTQPINQVQFQSPQPHELQWQQWPATQPAEQTTDNPANRISGNFAAANYGTTWR